jgi:hypothetical protein
MQFPRHFLMLRNFRQLHKAIGYQGPESVKSVDISALHHAARQAVKAIPIKQPEPVGTLILYFRGAELDH